MQLNEIRDNQGARKARMRVARGMGCTKGKTGGRGYKGQKSRTGVRINGFEGGQMPIHRRLPKRGFNNHFRVDYAEVNLDSLQRAVDSKSLDAGKPVNAEALIAAGLLRNTDKPVKLLGKGALTAKLNIDVDHASASAKAAVEKAGGKVTVKPPVEKPISKKADKKADKKK